MPPFRSLSRTNSNIERSWYGSKLPRCACFLAAAGEQPMISAKSSYVNEKRVGERPLPNPRPVGFDMDYLLTVMLYPSSPCSLIGAALTGLIRWPY